VLHPQCRGAVPLEDGGQVDGDGHPSRTMNRPPTIVCQAQAGPHCISPVIGSSSTPA
jgi:hypothetical protein